MLGLKVIGDGPRAVIVLHEWLGDQANWEAVWPVLDQGSFSYVFADLRGYGWPPHLTGDFSAQEASDDVAELMTKLGYQAFDVVGHSMSGMIAQKIALDHPARVRSQILFCPVPAAGFKADSATLAGMEKVTESKAALREAIIARGGGRHGDAWLERKIKIAEEAAAPSVKQAYLKMFPETDFSAEAAGSSTRTVIFHGARDIPFYQEESIKGGFESIYSDLEIHRLENCGHYPMLEEPLLVRDAIEKHLV